MSTLQRHRLVWLHDAAWSRLVADADVPGADADAVACLAHWAANDLPLVVTRQPGWRPGPVDDDRPVSLGIAAPLCWQRRRLRLTVAADGIRRSGDFPTLADVAAAAGRPAAWGTLATAIESTGAGVRVHGSVGRQHLSGLACVRDGSDLDLLVAVDSPAQADAAVAWLTAAAASTSQGPRLDGELLFDDGAAVAWREWAAWRTGAVRQLLVKRIDGTTLESDLPRRVAA